MLKCSDQCKGKLFEALYQSPEITDSARKMIDFGHLIIGLDARRSYISRNTSSTRRNWVGKCNMGGDIGGGVGMLAYRRTSDPKTRAKDLKTIIKN